MASNVGLKSLAILALTLAVCVQVSLGKNQWTLSYSFSSSSSSKASNLIYTLGYWVDGVGGITCENLNKDTCAFAVSSSSKRCVLEKHVRRSGEEAYVCRTSEIEADKVKDWVESDQCIEACGLDRKSLGISSDSLLECGFTHKLCSTQCYNSCPNIVDLYFNLAAGEGNIQTNPTRREINMHALIIFFLLIFVINCRGISSKTV